MPKPVASLAKKALGTADVFATPRKRGRPRKNAVIIAVAPTLVHVPEPEQSSRLPRIGR